MTTGTARPVPEGRPADATGEPPSGALPASAGAPVADQSVAQRLAAGAAHQMNNVLTVVSGHASVLLEILDDGHPARPGLEAILDASVSGAGLATQLLSYAADHQPPTESIAANELMHCVADAVRQGAGPRIEVLETAPLSPAHVRTTLAPLLQGFEFAGQFARALLLGTDGRVAVAAERVEEVLSITIRIELSDPRAMESAHLLEPYSPGAGVGKPDGMWLPAMAGSLRQAGSRLAARTRPGIVELRVGLSLEG